MKMLIFTFLITIVSKILGFVRELLLAYKFGASEIIDIYLIAESFPLLIFSFIFSGVSRSFISVYKDISKKRDKVKFVNNLLNINLILGIVFFVIIFLLNKQIIDIFFSNLSDTGKVLLKKMIIIFSMGIPLMTIINIFSGLFYYNNKILLVLFWEGILLNFFMIVAISIMGKNIILIPNIYLLALLLQSIFYFYYSKKIYFKYDFYIDYKDKNLKEIFKLGFSLSMSVFMERINLIIDKIFVLKYANGVVSCINYANKIQNIALDFSTTIMQLFLLVKLSRIKENEKVKKSLRKNISILISILLPISFFLWMFSFEIIKLIFNRGNFNLENVVMTKRILEIMCFGIVTYGISTIFVVVLSLNKQQKIIFRITLLSTILNIILNFTLSKIWNYEGIVISTVLSSWVSLICLYIELYKLYKDIVNFKILIELLKILLLNISLILNIYIFDKYINQNFWIQVLIWISNYFLFIYIFNIKIYKFYIRYIIKKVSGYNKY